MKKEEVNRRIPEYLYQLSLSNMKCDQQRITACIWFGLMPSPKSPSAPSDTHRSMKTILSRNNFLGLAY